MSDLINDIIYGRSLMTKKEKKLAAWAKYLSLDLDSILKELTGLDNLEKFKRTWKSDEEYAEEGTPERHEYDEAMRPALGIYYPLDERHRAWNKLRSRFQRAIWELLADEGIRETELGSHLHSKETYDPGDALDIAGRIRSHATGYLNGWLAYNHLNHLDAMETLYR
jgi:hypothetical protein